MTSVLMLLLLLLSYVFHLVTGMDNDNGSKQPIIFSRSWTPSKNVHFAVDMDDKDVLKEAVCHGDSKADINDIRSKEIEREEAKEGLNKETNNKKLNNNKPLKKPNDLEFVNANTDDDWRSSQTVKGRNCTDSYGRKPVARDVYTDVYKENNNDLKKDSKIIDAKHNNRIVKEDVADENPIVQADKINIPLEKRNNPEFVNVSTNEVWRSREAVKRRNRSDSYGRQKVSKAGSSSKSIRSHSSGKYGFGSRNDEFDNNNANDISENQNVISLDILKKARSSQELVNKAVGDTNEIRQDKEIQQSEHFGGIKKSRYNLLDVNLLSLFIVSVRTSTLFSIISTVLITHLVNSIYLYLVVLFL